MRSIDLQIHRYNLSKNYREIILCVGHLSPHISIVDNGNFVIFLKFHNFTETTHSTYDIILKLQ